MDFKKLIGLTIQEVLVEQSTIYDDDPSIVLNCDNGSSYRIEGGYGEETGESAHEFKSTLTLTSINTNRLSNTVKKVRGIRVQYGNNTRKEYQTIDKLVLTEFDKISNENKKEIVKDNLELLTDEEKLEIIRDWKELNELG